MEFDVDFSCEPTVFPTELVIGEDGVGIASVEQIVSDEDGGENVIIFKLTNGKEYRFTVRNGNTGDPTDIGLEAGKAEGSIQQNTATALGKNSVALGDRTIAGCHAWYIKHIDQTTEEKAESPHGSIYLQEEAYETTAQPTMTVWDYSEFPTTSEYQTDIDLGYDAEATLQLEIAIKNNTFYIYEGAIVTAIEGNRIDYSGDLGFTSIKANSGTTQNYSFWIPSAPRNNGPLILGSSALAEGQETIAAHDFSHTEGYNTVAGRYGHAEGNATKAGASAHSEGFITIAGGNGSHAEGAGSKAYKIAAHAEGRDSIANGDSAHAEGHKSSAIGEGAHSEGINTKATGIGSHAEGVDGEASGKSSHIEGMGGIASGEASHKEGKATLSSGKASHAEGINSTASSDAAHAEGTDTTASGPCSHVEGSLCKATKIGTHAEGVNSQANGIAAHAEGHNCIADGDRSHVEGLGCKTTTDALMAHAGGNACQANYPGSFLHGCQLRDSREYQAVVGVYNKVPTVDNGERFIVGCGKPGASDNAFIAGDSTVDGKYIKIGNTMITEAQVIKLLALIS